MSGQIGIDIVPQIVAKNHGNFHELLLPNNFVFADNSISVDFANFGSFTYRQEVSLKTPPTTLADPPTPMPCLNDDNLRELSPAECKEALLAWVKKSCCTASGPAKGTELRLIYNYNAYEYMLYTFTEKRVLLCEFSSCRPGERIDSVSNGQSPDPWSIKCEPYKNYSDHSKDVIIPHTDTLKPCFRCNAFGKLRCFGCNGFGNVDCGTCNGSGQTLATREDGSNYRVPCGSCNARGKVRCFRCSGNGSLVCDHCNGTQWLKWYLKVRAIFKNNLMEFFSEKTELPDVLLSTAQGGILKLEEGAQVLPISDCCNEEINRKSAKLIELAKQTLSGEKQLLQKHILKLISCTKCLAYHKENEFKFWIMGKTNEVYCPDYPGLKCCGCCCVCS